MIKEKCKIAQENSEVFFYRNPKQFFWEGLDKWWKGNKCLGKGRLGHNVGGKRCHPALNFPDGHTAFVGTDYGHLFRYLENWPSRLEYFDMIWDSGHTRSTPQPSHLVSEWSPEIANPFVPRPYHNLTLSSSNTLAMLLASHPSFFRSSLVPQCSSVSPTPLESTSDLLCLAHYLTSYLTSYLKNTSYSDEGNSPVHYHLLGDSA